MPRARSRKVDSDAESDFEMDSPPRAGPSAKARGKRRAVSSDEDDERPVAPKKSTAVDKRRLSRAPLANSSSSTDLSAPAPAAVVQPPQGRASIGNGLPSGLQMGKMAALANAARRVTSGGRTSAGLIMPDAMLAGFPNPLIPPVYSNEQYEEWMKLATDGKINASNTWNFALIDYFADMSLLRHSDGSTGINFQKASVTLDGCVKIWTLRVDSVGAETTKLMNGLSGANVNLEEGEEEDEEGEEEDGAGKGGKKKPKRGARSVKTLVDDIKKIQYKSLELEFSVDPLFKKTSADFDEGGASGILMNHLGCDTSLRIVFDALESLALPDEDAPVENAEELDATVNVAGLVAAHQDMLDDLESAHLCPSLASFKFSADLAAMDMGVFARHDASNASSNLTGLADVTAAAPAPGIPLNGFDNGGGYDDDDQQFFDDGPPGDADMDGGIDFFAGAAPAQDAMAFEARNPLGLFGPAKPGAQAGEGDGEFVAGADEGVFDMFDSAFAAKNWAGPSHWKMRRVATRTAASKGDSTAKTPARERKEKVVLQADFRAAAPSIKELFAQTNATTRLAASARTDSHVLPDDMHFDSKQLLSFFLKPKSRVHVRQRGPRQFGPAIGVGGGEDGPLDEAYWAARAEDLMNTDEPEESMAVPPFATQFFNDDGPDFDDEAMGDDVGDLAGTQAAVDEDDVDLLAQTKGKLKRVRPEYVSYAKKAKRVDVRKLKDTMWKELATELQPDEDGKPDFTKVISGLRRAYPKDKMDELSTSWLFICALHLANEHGLRYRMQHDAVTANILDNDAASVSVGRLTSLAIEREAESDGED